MQYATHIKLGKITNLSDARFAAAAGVAYIGFCFDQTSSAYIAPIKAKEMIDWITGSTIVAEFGNQSLEEITDITDLLDIAAVQIENDESPERLLSLGKAVIKRVNVSEYNHQQLIGLIDYFSNAVDAFQFYPHTSITDFPETAFKALNQKGNIFWEVDGTTEAIHAWVIKHKPFGIHLNGGEEEKAGLRDFDQLNELLEALNSED